MKKSTWITLGGYVLFMLLFYFIGMPKISFPRFLGTFALMTGVYAVIVFVIKKIYSGSKKDSVK